MGFFFLTFELIKTNNLNANNPGSKIDVFNNLNANKPGSEIAVSYRWVRTWCTLWLQLAWEAIRVSVPPVDAANDLAYSCSLWAMEAGWILAPSMGGLCFLVFRIQVWWGGAQVVAAAYFSTIKFLRFQHHLYGDVEMLVGVVWSSKFSSSCGDIRTRGAHAPMGRRIVLAKGRGAPNSRFRSRAPWSLVY
jgi:hypothetical protein